MLQKCKINEDEPYSVDSRLESRDSSPAGATGEARSKVGKFINMPQMDPRTLDVSLSNADAKKYVDSFDKYI